MSLTECIVDLDKFDFAQLFGYSLKPILVYDPDILKMLFT